MCWALLFLNISDTQGLQHLWKKNELSNTDHHCCLEQLSVFHCLGHLCNDQEKYPGHLFGWLQIDYSQQENSKVQNLCLIKLAIIFCLPKNYSVGHQFQFILSTTFVIDLENLPQAKQYSKQCVYSWKLSCVFLKIDFFPFCKV